MTKREEQAREYAADQAAREEVALADWEVDAKKSQREFTFIDFAQAALTGLCISRHLDTKEDVARQAFDYADAMMAEFDKRTAAKREAVT